MLSQGRRRRQARLRTGISGEIHTCSAGLAPRTAPILSASGRLASLATCGTRWQHQWQAKSVANSVTIQGSAPRRPLQPGQSIAIGVPHSVSQAVHPPEAATPPRAAEPQSDASHRKQRLLEQLGRRRHERRRAGRLVARLLWADGSLSHSWGSQGQFSAIRVKRQPMANKGPQMVGQPRAAKDHRQAISFTAPPRATCAVRFLPRGRVGEYAKPAGVDAIR